jgi:hypothetical protein
MKAAQLAELNGLVALAIEARAAAGDSREMAAIVDELLADAEMPDLRAVNERIARRVMRRRGRR